MNMVVDKWVLKMVIDEELTLNTLLTWASLRGIPTEVAPLIEHVEKETEETEVKPKEAP